MTERKCTRCHTLDRIQVAQISQPRQWATTIDQMRRMPASGISAADGRTIARCLVFRGFGLPGLRELERAPPPEGLDDLPPLAAQP
ncbi:MAG: hypothetical protein K8W52_43995 [Deltaproteobacteria bacterium]|nr:hypothetical protein [Deltaproteobacteria bacterium]